MRLDDIPISRKLPVTMGFSLLLTLAVTGLFAVAIVEILAACRSLWAHEMVRELQGQELAMALLQARRGEKDFLLRHDPAHAEGVRARVQEARVAAEKLKAVALAGDVRPVEALSQLRTYQEAFERVEAVWRAKGLTPEQGLQGAFRTAAHHLEELLDQGQQPELTIGYLTLRRQEKDYLLRQEERHVQQVQQRMGAFRVEVARSTLAPGDKEAILGHLEDYAAAFQALVIQEGELRIALEVMRQAAHRVEELAQAIRVASIDQAVSASQVTQAFGERVFQTITPIAVVLTLLAGVVMSLILREILRDLGRLHDYARTVATGNLEAESGVSSRDEIGDLARVLGDMVQHMRVLRVVADRMVFIMVLIGRGTIPERIEGRFPGDLQKICDALNGMITQLSEIRAIADQIQQAGNGSLPDRVDGRFEGDFRKLVEAVNGLIDRLRQAVDPDLPRHG